MPRRHAWGQHLILDLADCPVERLKDEALIRRWTEALVEAVGMCAYGPPIIEHFGARDPETAGYTVVQLIETSSICAHFAENVGEVYIDLFSCKSFDSERAVALCRHYFEPRSVEIRTVQRGGGTRQV